MNAQPLRSLPPLSLTGLVALALLGLLGAGCQQPPESPDVLRMTVESSSPFVLAAEPGEIALSLDIIADPPKDLERKPLNLGLVIDHSGSMTGDQMADARRAIRALLDRLAEDDMVSVIAFGSRVEVLQAQSAWEDVDKEALYAAVAAIQPRGTTAMGDALQTALAQVGSTWDTGRVNRVILLTDGIPNDPNLVLQASGQARSQQIAVTTMGLGPQFNETLMAQVADLTGGQYRFIASSDQIADVFDAQRESLEKTVARGATMTFTFGPGVHVTNIYGAPQANVLGQRVEVFLGDMDAQTTRKLGLRLQVDGQPAGAHIEIADAVLSYQDPVTGATRERFVYIEAEASADPDRVETSRKADVLKRLEQFGALQDMEGAIEQWEAGDTDNAREGMKSAAARFKANRLSNIPTNAAEGALGALSGAGGLGRLGGLGAGAAGGEGLRQRAGASAAPLAAMAAPVLAATPAATPAAAEAPAEEAQVEAYMEAQLDNIERVDPSSSAGKLVGKDVRALHRNTLGY